MLTHNYFELFDLPCQFAVDVSQLKRKHHQLLQEVHPDKHVNAGAYQTRLSVQTSAHVNKAYETLCSPLLRAQYILQLKDIEADFTNTTIDDAAFLMHQMQWRESLSEHIEAEALPAIEALDVEVNAFRRGLLDNIEKNLADHQLDAARECVGQLYFIEKMISSIESAIDQLDP